jgi:hypothetical protein
VAGALVSSSARAADSVSSNWSGYAATAPGHSTSHFRKVSGTWTVPSATCTAGTETYSAAWVGLGGFKGGSDALEQIGTDADCSRAGGAASYAWFELVPAAPVDLKIDVRPGDEISASVAVSVHRVTLRVHDLTSGGLFMTTRLMSDPDVSSAEWIVEAPSVCIGSNACTTLPLSDFGTLSFSSASAMLGSRSGVLGSSDWALTELEMQQGSGYARGPGSTFHNVAATQSILATPSAVQNPAGAFTVAWQEQQSTQAEQPSRTELPGAAGQPPTGELPGTGGTAG